jgi:adenine phosphoribosyltransferase
MQQLLSLIKDVPDYPKPGILFKDFTPLLADPKGLALAVELMTNPYRGTGVDVVVGAESRGFIFGIAIAQALSCGFVPIRKKGKLPREVRRVTYNLEYGTDTLEMHADAVKPGQRVLVVDDLLATGGTLQACCELLSGCGGVIAGITVLIELPALHGSDRVAKFGHVHSVLKY